MSLYVQEGYYSTSPSQYTSDRISVNWATKVITVPRDEMLLVQSVPIEIRSLDLDAFRLKLKELEAEEDEGITYLDTHNHNTTVTVGGVTLARVIEIINGYTVTFENGNYAVNLVGANSNVGDVVNLNNVQVRSANSAGLTYSKEVQDQSFLDSRVYIDTVKGENGTTYPLGTIGSPVKTQADGRSISTRRGLGDRYLLFGSITLTGSLAQQNWRGTNTVQSSITLSSLDTEGAVFDNLEITGTVGGHCHIENSVINGLTNFEGDLDHCALDGTLTLPSSPSTLQYVMHQCYSAVAGASMPIIDFNSAGNLDFSIRDYDGGIEIRNFNQANNNMTIDLNSGHAKLDASCTNGTIVIRGVGQITDNSAGATVVTTGLVSPSNIADYIWDEAIADHTSVGSTGEALDTISAGASPAQIADAVWDEATTDHLTVGSFGAEVATKTDILASSGIEEQFTYFAGSIVQGDLDGGTIANTVVRDNNYWIIGENTTNGITVEFTFRLPSSEYKARTFSIFGRYEGGAQPSHHIELWAWDVEGASWEILHDIFMSHSTTDDEYLHRYSERHIDRDNNNEVKLRLIHHSVSYIGSHALYLDAVAATASVPVTAEAVADAVWDEDLSTHTTTGSAGKIVKALLSLKQFLGLK
jgi:hypothetical protein